MSCYLIVSDVPRECEGCTREIAPGIVGLTNELDGRLVAQCQMCLFSLDRRLAAVWITSFAGANFEGIADVIRALLKRPEWADLAEPQGADRVGPRRKASMARNEKTSARVASIASRGLKDPKSLTPAEIKTISASVMTQKPDKKKKPARKRRPPKK